MLSYLTLKTFYVRECIGAFWVRTRNGRDLTHDGCGGVVRGLVRYGHRCWTEGFVLQFVLVCQCQDAYVCLYKPWYIRSFVVRWFSRALVHRGLRFWFVVSGIDRTYIGRPTSTQDEVCMLLPGNWL